MSSEHQDIEQILIHCHMALIGIWPASDAWGEVEKWLKANSKSEYAEKLRASVKEAQ